MCSVIKQQQVGGGQCSRRDWMARLIFIADGPTTNAALAIWMESFGLDLTSFTAWPKARTGFELIWRTLLAKLFTPSTACLLLPARGLSTNLALEHTQVIFYFYTLLVGAEWRRGLASEGFGAASTSLLLLLYARFPRTPSIVVPTSLDPSLGFVFCHNLRSNGRIDVTNDFHPKGGGGEVIGVNFCGNVNFMIPT